MYDALSAATTHWNAVENFTHIQFVFGTSPLSLSFREDGDMPVAFKVENVLEELDGEVEECRFPIFGVDEASGESSVGIRLHAFSSDDSWLLAFERLMFYSPIREYRTSLDGLSTEDYVFEFRYPIEVLLPDGTWSHSVWKDELDPQDCKECVLDPLDFKLRIKGVTREFAFTKDDFLAIGVELEDPDAGLNDRHGSNLPVHILRIIDRELGDELYASPSEILARLQEADPKSRSSGRKSCPEYEELQHLITLKHYFHPPYHDPEPSETETFRMLAEVMVYKDATRYHPSEEPNTRWSDWPFRGFQA